MTRHTLRWAVGLAVAGLIVAPGAWAWYVDGEKSPDNVWGAATLDLSLRDFSDVVLTALLFDEDDFGPGSLAAEEVRVKNDGSLDATYGTLAVKTGGDTGLCDALQLEAEVDGSPVYDGSLTGFNEDTAGTLLTGTSDDWDFEVSLDDDDAALSDKTCEFDFVFEGWQTASDGTWGFTDTELTSNEITTGTWAAAGDVVINEIMWMGSNGDSDDEWMELRNMTSSPVDLTGWTIDGAESGLPGTLALSGTLGADDYFLVSRKAVGDSAINDSITPDMVVSGLSFVNGGEVLTLKNQFAQTIDETPSGSPWAAGENGSPEKRSMERNDTPGDGTVAGNWHDCIDVVCNDTTYWDTEGDDYGTPKALNHSDNDLSLIAEQVQQQAEGEESEEAGEEEEATGAGGEEGEEEEGEGSEDEGTGEEESGEGGGGEEGETGDDGTEGEADGKGDEEDPTTLADGELRGAGEEV